MINGFSAPGCTALVTGANQGIGRGFVEALLERGCARVYATARRSDTLDGLAALDRARVIPLELDVVNDAQRQAAAKVASDVTLLINNAGIPGSDEPRERRFLSATTLADARLVMEVDFFAQAEMCRAFAPTLVANRPAAIVNILSIGALFCLPEYSTYCAAKSAAAIMTKGVRAELARSGVFVAGVFTGGVDTRMAAKNVYEKMSPIDHARQVLDAVAAGVEDIFAGTGAERIRDAVKSDEKAFERSYIERFHTAPIN
ncbi:MAG: SDR family NAD(P)-dependent oxidoreductase [Rhodospirillaceae bacterium]|nr:SDR family NAD(P)-dependent oxidoreductase [Rhodospirillaceae bacterium]